MHDAEVLALDDGLVASVGLPDLAARPPDHVAFSPGCVPSSGSRGTRLVPGARDWKLTRRSWLP